MSNTLITGGSGTLGRELKKLLPDALTPTRHELNLMDDIDPLAYVMNNDVSTIIHCGAMTSVRACEEDKERAYITNALATSELLKSLQYPSRDVVPYFIYISTACVFPGTDYEMEYTENDTPYPKNYYSLTKYMGEVILENVRAYATDYLIIRTNFVDRGKWPYLWAFTDRFGTYLFADQVAEEIVKAIEQRKTRTIHICGDKRMSMFELARLTDSNVEPMTIKDYSGPPLTMNMCLDSKRWPKRSIEGEKD